MEIIKHGAEAILYKDSFDGQTLLVKERVRKGYRITEIDEKLRKLRTREEVKLLTEARKCGVLTPQIVHVDDGSFKIFMEFVDGKRVKEFLNSATENEIQKLSYQIGKSIGRLHSREIIHGDLTTSNMLLKEGKLYFIDFGLGKISKKIEDKAVDLSLLYEALRSTHFKILETCWGEIKKGYREENSNSEEVFEQLKKIEKRGRYSKREALE